MNNTPNTKKAESIITICNSIIGILFLAWFVFAIVHAVTHGSPYPL